MAMTRKQDDLPGLVVLAKVRQDQKALFLLHSIPAISGHFLIARTTSPTFRSTMLQNIKQLTQNCLIELCRG